jgi:hypothetical protein
MFFDWIRSRPDPAEAHIANLAPGLKSCVVHAALDRLPDFLRELLKLQDKRAGAWRDFNDDWRGHYGFSLRAVGRSGPEAGNATQKQLTVCSGPAPRLLSVGYIKRWPPTRNGLSMATVCSA